MLEMWGDRVTDRPRTPDASQDWRAAIEEVNRKTQDLVRRVYRQSQRYATVVEDVEATNTQIATLNANSERIQQSVQALKTQFTAASPNVEQTQSIVRRELVFYRNMVDACMRRLGVIEGNINVLTDMSNQVMARVADAADMIQDVQRNPRGP